MAEPEIQRVCAYCDKAVCISDGEELVCEVRGVVTADNVCRKFKYDPLKRVPEPALSIAALELPDEEA